MKKGEYQIREAGSGELVPVQAWEFDLLGIGPLIVHRDPMYPNTWSVSEPVTGGIIKRQYSTRKGAIQGVTEIVHVHQEWGKETFIDYQKFLLTKYADIPTDYYKKQQEAEEEGNDVRTIKENEGRG